MIKKSVLIFLPANDFNEDEYLTVKNSLDKTGIKVFIASDANNFCEGSKLLKVKNDINILNIHPNNFDAVIFIGGPGIKKYFDNLVLRKIILKLHSSKKIIAAICSAPVILAKAGILKNCKATCNPGDKNELLMENIDYMDKDVVNERNIITANSPKAAAEFIASVISSLR